MTAMSGAQVLGLSLLTLVIVVGVMRLDRSQGRIARWLYTPQLRIRIPARPWWHAPAPSSVVNFDEERRRRAELHVALAMGQRGGRS